MNQSENETPRSVLGELRAAGLLAVGSVAALIVAAYAFFAWHFSAVLDKLGQFGDSFGVLTSLFTALAFAGVVATVVLQTRELRETRQELAKQAEAQREWAAAAREQLSHSRAIEALRLRPIIKFEWRIAQGETFDTRIQLCIKNVGLGTAIIDTVMLTNTNGDRMRNDDSHMEDRDAQWTALVSEISPVSQQSGKYFGVNDYNRAIAPMEDHCIGQIFTTQTFEADKIRESAIRNVFIHADFRSISGQRFSTDGQYEGLELMEQTTVGNPR